MKIDSVLVASFIDEEGHLREQFAERLGLKSAVLPDAIDMETTIGIVKNFGERASIEVVKQDKSNFFLENAGNLWEEIFDSISENIIIIINKEAIIWIPDYLGYFVFSAKENKFEKVVKEIEAQRGSIIEWKNSDFWTASEKNFLEKGIIAYDHRN